MVAHVQGLCGSVSECFRPVSDGLWSLAQKIGQCVLGVFLSIQCFFEELFSYQHTPFLESIMPSQPVEQAKIIQPLEEVPPEIYASVQITPLSIAKAPKPIELDKLKQTIDSVQPPIEVEELLTQYDKIFKGVPNDEILCKGDGKRNKSLARSTLEMGYINFIKSSGNLGVYKEYMKLARPEISCFLRAIILELRKEEIPLDKKQDVLKDLIETADHCPPRRHTGSLRVYRTISNQLETVEETLLQYIQLIKEDLFRDFYSLSGEPVATLNWIRAQIGIQVGLDVSPVHLGDMYIDMHDASFREDNKIVRHREPKEFLGVFNKIYTPESLLKMMKWFLNSRIRQDPTFTRTVSQFISDAIENLKNGNILTQAEVDQLPEPYQHDYAVEDKGYHLTWEGVRFLLVRCGFLTPTEPHGHLAKVKAE
jgi:hypothetical protein